MEVAGINLFGNYTQKNHMIYIQLKFMNVQE